MGWPVLFVASTISAVIIIYTLWPNRGNKKYRKFLAIFLAVAAFIIPSSFKYTMDEKQTITTAEINEIFSQLPEPELSEWNGELTVPPSSDRMNMSLAAVTIRLEEKLRSNPDDLSGWILLSRSYVALGNPSKALGLLNEISDKYSDNIDFLVSYGEILTQINQGVITENAKEQFLSALALDAKDPYTGYNLALYDIQQQQYQLAYDRLKTLLDEAPVNSIYIFDMTEKMNFAADQLGLPSE